MEPFDQYQFNRPDLIGIGERVDALLMFREPAFNVVGDAYIVLAVRAEQDVDVVVVVHKVENRSLLDAIPRPVTVSPPNRK